MIKKALPPDEKDFGTLDEFRRELFYDDGKKLFNKLNKCTETVKRKEAGTERINKQMAELKNDLPKAGIHV